MTILANAHQLSKSFGARSLFSGLTFAIESNERIGLIGPNGAGKSTLLRILAGQMAPDSGTLSFQRGMKVGFMEQVPTFAPDAYILSTVLEGSNDPYEWENISLAHEFISKLELDAFEVDTPIAKLSGGWKKRVALAREMIKKPDLLLLDEPTNHLDVESILWLEKFLSRSDFSTLTITHDRLFLQRVSDRIIELDSRHPGGLLSVKGDYAAYVEVRSQLISAQERREVILKNTLRRETEWLRQGAKARTTKQQARINRAGDLKETVEDLTTRNQTRTARIDFQSAEKNPKKLIEAKSISKKYGDRKIITDFDLMVTPGMRIGLLGSNGSGKSTLIRILLGFEAPSAGMVLRSEHLSVAYFDQTREALDPNVTLSKTLCPSGDYVDYRGARVHIRSYLDRFLFTSTQMDMPVGKLSGGEQARILIAKLMLTQANILVLDEPTNDLDMATLSVLEECLTEFNGAVILVSHDRYFLDQVANKILAFPKDGSGKLISFSDLNQWESWYLDQPKNQPPIPEKAALKTDEVAAGKKKKLGFKEQRELDSMEANIKIVEDQLAVLVHESSLPQNASNSVTLAKISEQMSELQKEIDRLYHRWTDLES